jgi:hypothetical protein
MRAIHIVCVCGGACVSLLEGQLLQVVQVHAEYVDGAERPARRHPQPYERPVLSRLVRRRPTHHQSSSQSQPCTRGRSGPYRGGEAVEVAVGDGQTRRHRAAARFGETEPLPRPWPAVLRESLALQRYRTTHDTRAGVKRERVAMGGE